MTYTYDLRLTFRNYNDPKFIDKQFYIQHMEFNNPITVPSQLILPHPNNKNTPIFFCKVLEVYHSPNPNSTSYIEAEWSSGVMDYNVLEELLMEKYDCERI